MAEYIEHEAALNQFEDSTSGLPEKLARIRIEEIPAADVVARDCFDKILAENDDMRAIIDTYGGLENIQSAFVKLHKIENADVVPVRHGKWETAFLAHEYFGCRPYAHYCSVCHQIIAFRTFYCPNCGARMDGDGDGV